VSQINVNPGGGARDAGVGSVLAIVVVLVVVAILVFAFAFGGFQRFGGGPAVAPATSNAPAGQSGTTINVEPKVNVQAPAPAGNAPGYSGSTPAKP
jgi:hypothetical protein